MFRLLAIATLCIGFALLGARFAIATTLFGGVQHADYVAPASRYNYTFGSQLQTLQPLPSTLNLAGSAQQSGGAVNAQANSTFQAQARRRIDWFKIPPWMAGRWYKKGDMTINVTDLRTGRSSNMQQWTDDEMTVSWGKQVDRDGNIWDANFVPSERDGVSDGKSVRFLLVNLRCEASSPEQVVTRMHYVVSESAAWGQLVDQFQQESINDYTPLSNDEIQNCSSTRVFTYEGSPTRNGILLSKFTRVAPFQPISFQDGVDLKSSLSDFLRSHQMPDLAPDQSSPDQNNSAKNLPVVPEPF